MAEQIADRKNAKSVGRSPRINIAQDFQGAKISYK